MAMEPHPDFAATDWPRDFTLGGHRLTPLSHQFVDEDYAAVMATAPLLGGFFGSWPEGLTREENLIDLAWHDREFTTRRSFSWIIRDGGGIYIGCFYLSPLPGMTGHAKADLWLCDIPDRSDRARALVADLAGWLADNMPSGITLTWATSPKLD